MKAAYAKSLAEESLTGRLDLATSRGRRGGDRAMTRVKGIGRWSAEIYLLFAEGRLDIWPGRATSRSRSRSAASSASPRGPRKRRPGTWPNPGARTAAPPRSSHGTTATSRRSERNVCVGMPVPRSRR
jgi:3-methyladenine DNA glycosylase/8-oxoguanine DNA glycosylase